MRCWVEAEPGASERNTPDNLRLAAGKHGLDRRDIPPCMTFFAPVAVAEDGALAWEAGLVRPGQHVDLRAEMDLLVAISNCPHPSVAQTPKRPGRSRRSSGRRRLPFRTTNAGR